jgi:hypothetical protein
MKTSRLFQLASVVLVSAGFCAAAAAVSVTPQIELISVERIWDEGDHNAFTDLVRFQGAWYCTFREGDGHVRGDGLIRIIRSEDGESWTSAALLEEPGIDLRDPKVSVTPDGRLMVLMGGSVYVDGEYQGRQPRVAFSNDGTTFTPPQRILDEGDWLWRVTWHQGMAYGVSYQRAEDGEGTQCVLFRSENGVDYERITRFEIPDSPNEVTLRFDARGVMYALVRRERGDTQAWIGRSGPPFTDWDWNPAGMRFGGPEFIILPDGYMWAAGREYGEGGATTVIAHMTHDTLTPLLTLPSGGDTSYPGMVWHEGELWMSYYASHEEGKSSIYLARFRFPPHTTDFRVPGDATE